MELKAIHDAIRSNDRDAFVESLDSADPQFDVNSVSQTRYANWFTGVGATLLQLTAFVRPALARDLLNRGAKLDFHSACALGDIDAVQRELNENPHVVNTQVEAFYPLQFALAHPGIVRKLLEHGDDPNRLLRKIAWFEWEDVVADAGLSEWRPIHMLALGRGREPRTETAEVFKEFGADLTPAASPFGERPIHLSAIYDRDALIRWFVKNGVDVDIGTAAAPDNTASTELFNAEAFAPFESHEQTPLMLALGEGKSNAVDALIQLGADVHATDSAGFTPLHYAAGSFWGENTDNVERLIAHGANLNATDTEGRRPVDLARQKGYESTATLLE